MCLYKDKKYHPFNRPLIAAEDIVCYKVLIQPIHTSPDIFRTPFQLESIRVQIYLDCQIPFIAQDDGKFCSFLRHKLGFSKIVGSGFIHTYRDRHSIPLLACEFVFKCIIPKGTEYFIGINNDYASKKIIFLEKIEEN